MWRQKKRNQAVIDTYMAENAINRSLSLERRSRSRDTASASPGDKDRREAIEQAHLAEARRLHDEMARAVLGQRGPG